jgi:hypothetical protein
MNKSHAKRSGAFYEPLLKLLPIKLPPIPVRVSDEIIVFEVSAAPGGLISVTREMTVLDERAPDAKLAQQRVSLRRKAFANPFQRAPHPCKNQRAHPGLREKNGGRNARGATAQDGDICQLAGPHRCDRGDLM